MAIRAEASSGVILNTRELILAKTIQAQLGGRLWLIFRNDAMPAFPGLNRTYSSNLPLPDNLDQVVSPEVVNTIIGLFFDYVRLSLPSLTSIQLII